MRTTVAPPDSCRSKKLDSTADMEGPRAWRARARGGDAPGMACLHRSARARGMQTESMRPRPRDTGAVSSPLMRVILTVTGGPHAGESFAFEEHDTFIVG